MKLTQSEFKKKLRDRNLILTMIGMSNIGKTFWSKKLRSHNFHHINCDAILETMLEPELKALGYRGLADMAKWMGHPYEEHFKKNEKKLTGLESLIFQKIINDLEKPLSNTAVDTPGSFIYAGEKICDLYKEKSLIIYLEATSEMKEKMFENFIKNPKPITWMNSFNKRENESDFKALKRCYPELLAYRSRHYEKYTDITIPYPKLNKNFSAEKFLELIEQSL